MVYVRVCCRERAPLRESIGQIVCRNCAYGEIQIYLKYTFASIMYRDFSLYWYNASDTPVNVLLAYVLVNGGNGLQINNQWALCWYCAHSVNTVIALKLFIALSIYWRIFSMLII